VREEHIQESGKAATAVVNQDGTFILSTYGRFDGAIIGKHRVVYQSDEGETDEEANDPQEEHQSDSTETAQRPQPGKPKSVFSACVQTKEILVEVTNRENEFTIEL
jgi:altronate dehydratase